MLLIMVLPFLRAVYCCASMRAMVMTLRMAAPMSLRDCRKETYCSDSARFREYDGSTGNTDILQSSHQEIDTLL